MWGRRGGWRRGWFRRPGFELELVRSGQLKNVSAGDAAEDDGRSAAGRVECVRLMREFRPQVVVGVGGYASGPAMIAAMLLRVPTLAYEPNAVPGHDEPLVGK